VLPAVFLVSRETRLIGILSADLSSVGLRGFWRYAWLACFVVSFEDLAVHFASFSGDLGHLFADVGESLKEAAEIALAERGEFAVVQCGDIGGARLAVDESHLAKIVASVQADDLATADRNLDLTLGDEVDGIGLLTRANDAFAGLGAFDNEVQDEDFALLRAETREEREALGKFLGGEGLVRGGFFGGSHAGGFEFTLERFEVGLAAILEAALEVGFALNPFCEAVGGVKHDGV